MFGQSPLPTNGSSEKPCGTLEYRPTTSWPLPSKWRTTSLAIALSAFLPGSASLRPSLRSSDAHQTPLLATPVGTRRCCAARGMPLPSTRIQISSSSLASATGPYIGRRERENRRTQPREQVFPKGQVLTKQQEWDPRVETRLNRFTFS